MTSERIKRLRKETKLSQRKFAIKYNFTDAQISQWESGKSRPDIDSVKRLAAIFGVSTDYLLGYPTLPQPELKNTVLYSIFQDEQTLLAELLNSPANISGIGIIKKIPKDDRKMIISAIKLALKEAAIYNLEAEKFSQEGDT